MIALAQSTRFFEYKNRLILFYTQFLHPKLKSFSTTYLCCYGKVEWRYAFNAAAQSD